MGNDRMIAFETIVLTISSVLACILIFIFGFIMGSKTEHTEPAKKVVRVRKPTAVQHRGMNGKLAPLRMGKGSTADEIKL